MRVLTILSAAAIALSAAATPASAQHDRDRQHADDRGPDDTSGFHRYYGSGYYETDESWKNDRRNGPEWRDDHRERRHHDRARRRDR